MAQDEGTKPRDAIDLEPRNDLQAPQGVSKAVPWGYWKKTIKFLFSFYCRFIHLNYICVYFKYVSTDVHGNNY